MSHKKQSPQLVPIRGTYLIGFEKTTFLEPADITTSTVGEKAFGLSCIPMKWSLPFMVVDREFFRFYILSPQTCHLLLNELHSQFVEAGKYCGIQENDFIIVRSSGCLEGVIQRGRYHSCEGKLEEVLAAIWNCLEKIGNEHGLNTEMPLIIQKLATSVSRGHLSNERRFYREKRDWIGQFGDAGEDYGGCFQINLRNWREHLIPGNRPNFQLNCTLSAHIKEVLKYVAAWAKSQDLRLHFEWVWNGKTIYIVQADKEKISSGENPSKFAKQKFEAPSTFTPQCLECLQKHHAHKYTKINNVFTYLELGLPTAKLYVLENESLFKKIIEQRKVPTSLKRDIKELVQESLVIRTDVATSDLASRQLLPRSHEERNSASAEQWLVDQIKDLNTKVNTRDLAFIFHNFIPAESSAFVLAVPKQRKVQIEALWGLPEGLYYYSHDQYVVDTQAPEMSVVDNIPYEDFSLVKKLRYKCFFVAPNKKGEWKTHRLAPPYDWSSAIQYEMWAKRIAFQSRQIAESEDRPVSIMWFVGVPEAICNAQVFPWYHEHCDVESTYTPKPARQTTPFDKELVVTCNEDIQFLKQESKRDDPRIGQIHIQPKEESLLRNKDLLKEIGELAQKIGAVIYLEGAVLSHAYYQLLRTGATVEVINPLEESREQHDFNKLVRDRIPHNIQKGGEYVRTVKLSGENLLRALKDKLVEEAFEVLDATSREEILSELADVREITETLLKHINSSEQELVEKQTKKREKAGSFEDHVVLLETDNPSPNASDSKEEKKEQSDLFQSAQIGAQECNYGSNEDQNVLDRAHQIKKWTDRRDHSTQRETVIRITVPVVRDAWSTSAPSPLVKEGKKNNLQSKIQGKRVGSYYQFDVSLYFSKDEPNLFDYAEKHKAK